MANKKRKDHEGRLLQEGESQRKDLIYIYRWTNDLGKREVISAKTLDELRKKEKRSASNLA